LPRLTFWSAMCFLKLFQSQRLRGCLALFAVMSLCLTPPARGDELAEPGHEDLGALSLEDLMTLEITSVSKQRQKTADSPAAIYVITQDDIRRSGMNSIPELLRLSPGLTVSQVSANQWAVSARGFHDVFADKLLVMMDGRTIYSPLFSGVYWDQQDYVLADLDRIEVIRGPGATLWGANAVNGVINITSKSARDTQGFLADTTLGTEDQIGSLRYGGRFDDRTFYRAYVKYRDTDDSVTLTNERAHDGWESLRGGFRIDRYATDTDTFTLQGDAYSGSSGETLAFPSFSVPFNHQVDTTARIGGANILARWTHVVSATSDFDLQLYYDRVERKDAELTYHLDTWDIDFNHRFELTKSQHLIYGAGLRLQRDLDLGAGPLFLTPEQRTTYIASAFVQDSLTLIPDRLQLFLGTKLESNSYSGFEVQPGARMMWTPNASNSVWASVSRAVRTPARYEQDITRTVRGVPTGTPLPGQTDVVGNPDFESETLIAYELGYRFNLGKNVSVDLAGFYNDYDKIRSVATGSPFLNGSPAPLHLVVPLTFGNKIQGATYGGEVAATWNVTDQWRLSGSYSLLFADFRTNSAAVDPQQIRDLERSAPRNQFQIHSAYQLSRDIDVNAALYYTDNIGQFGIPSFVRVDANVAWRPTKGLEWTVGVQNALDDQHPEFASQVGDRRSEVEWTFYTQLVFKW
jgi:iron complex outermembrane receptor protein